MIPISYNNNDNNSSNYSKNNNNNNINNNKNNSGKQKGKKKPESMKRSIRYHSISISCVKVTWPFIYFGSGKSYLLSISRKNDATGKVCLVRASVFYFSVLGVLCFKVLNNIFFSLLLNVGVWQVEDVSKKWKDDCKNWDKITLWWKMLQRQRQW